MSRAERTVCVYCASSTQCAPVYHKAAARLGRLLARAGWHTVFGGGARGSMGALADGALDEGGRVTGVIPHFMKQLEWAHDNLTELKVVDDMRVRKHLMLVDSDAVVALPGGTGTFEELFEALTLKRLGIWPGPIVLVNMEGYYEPLLELMRRSIDERFMHEKQRGLMTVVESVDDVVDAIEATPDWGDDAREYAAI